MPIANHSIYDIIPLKISVAKTRKSRALGLLGTNKIDKDKALLIEPCRSVHTFGMRYAIDIIFLDNNSNVVQMAHSVKPNVFVSPNKKTRFIVELAGGRLKELPINMSDSLEFIEDEEYKSAPNAMQTFLHWPTNIGLGILWGQLVYLSILKWQTGGEPLSLGIIVYNTLLLMMFFTRRESVETSKKFIDWFIPIGTAIASMLFRPIGVSVDVLGYASSIIQVTGITAIILSLGSLGRSFGIIPANRRVKISGAYSFVRHPLYSSELIFYVGFLLGHPSSRNFILFTLIFLGQLWRAVSEEKLLLKDDKYRKYYATVPYRFIPGVF
jgi:protein-S-isoprenylcysteine O-methyltransferase Ste14/uncharacterized membrane protein (UPF0127 family)